MNFWTFGNQALHILVHLYWAKSKASRCVVTVLRAGWGGGVWLCKVTNLVSDLHEICLMYWSLMPWCGFCSCVDFWSVHYFHQCVCVCVCGGGGGSRDRTTLRSTSKLFVRNCSTWLWMWGTVTVPVLLMSVSVCHWLMRVGHLIAMCFNEQSSKSILQWEGEGGREREQHHIWITQVSSIYLWCPAFFIQRGRMNHITF